MKKALLAFLACALPILAAWTEGITDKRKGGNDENK